MGELLGSPLGLTSWFMRLFSSCMGKLLAPVSRSFSGGWDKRPEYGKSPKEVGAKGHE